MSPPRDGGACQSTSRGQLLTALCKASTCSGWRNDASMVQQECSVCRESAAERAPQSLASTCVAASVWRLRQRARLLRGSSELCCCYTERLGGATAAAATAATSSMGDHGTPTHPLYSLNVPLDVLKMSE